MKESKRNRLLLKYSIFVYFILCLSASAQENYQIENLGMSDGLSWILVESICQDHDGNIWIGTLQGLNKYDGYKFVTLPLMDKENETHVPQVRTMCVDKEGCLWVGELFRGIKKFDPKENSFEHYMSDPDDTNSLSNDTTTTILCDNDNNLWIGTNNGLNKYSVSENTFTILTHDSTDINSLSYNAIRCLMLDTNNHLWIGTYSGLNRFNLETNEITRFLHNPHDPHSLMDNNIESIFEDSERTIWIRTVEGLSQYVSGNIFFHYRTEILSLKKGILGFYNSTINETDDGNLWIASRGGGLLKFNKRSGEFTSFSKDFSPSIHFGSNEIPTLFKDRSGVLWIGSVTSGVYKLIETKNKFQVLKVPFTNTEHWANVIYSVCAEAGSDSIIWLGTRKNGIVKYNLQLNKYDFFDLSSTLVGFRRDDNYRSIIEIGNNNLLIAVSNKGLLRYDKNLHTGSRIEGTTLKNLWVMVKDPCDDNLYWIGSTEGLHRFDLSTETLTAYNWNFTNQDIIVDVRSIYIDNTNGNKTLWAGTYQNGLLKIDLATALFEQFKNDDGRNSISHNYVKSIYKDKHGHVWIGTENGLNRLNESTGTIDIYTTENGLSNNKICGLVEDKESFLWISTRSGISKYDPERDTFTNYFEEDGIHGNFFMVGSTAVLNDGRLFWGGYFGFTIIDTKPNNTNIPTLILKSFKVHNKIVYDSFDLSRMSEIKLSYKNNFFTIEFAALDFRQPERNRFYYILDQFESNWNYSLTNRAEYKNVDPGEYKFIVKGSNNDGIWNEEGTSIKIVILPPWWMTWWARITLGILLFSLIFYMFDKRTKYHKAEKEKQEKYAQSLIESQENERKRIASELHDSLGQNLLLVNNEIQQFLLRSEEKSEEIAEASDLVKESLGEVRAISHRLHPHQLDKLGLRRAIDASIKKISHATNIKFSREIEEVDGLLRKEKEIHYYRILQEIFNNVIKHSEANHVSVEIYKRDSVLVTNIKDDGIGFNLKKRQMQDTVKEGLGLHGMDERAKMLGSNLNIKSSPGMGTEIELVIPLSLNEDSHRD